MNVKREIMQVLVGFLFFKFSQSIVRTTYGHGIEIQIMDVWEYIYRRLPGISIVEVERTYDELEQIGIMRNGRFISTESIDPQGESKKRYH